MKDNPVDSMLSRKEFAECLLVCHQRGEKGYVYHRDRAMLRLFKHNIAICELMTFGLTHNNLKPPLLTRVELEAYFGYP